MSIPATKVWGTVRHWAGADYDRRAGHGGRGYWDGASRNGAPPQADIPPISLIEQHGRTVTRQDFVGKPSLIFVGFTNGPSICPTALAEIAARMADLGPLADRLNVIFVTADPERDTPEVLREYLASFDNRIIGLTGKVAEITARLSHWRELPQGSARRGQPYHRPFRSRLSDGPRLAPLRFPNSGAGRATQARRHEAERTDRRVIKPDAALAPDAREKPLATGALAAGSPGIAPHQR